MNFTPQRDSAIFKKEGELLIPGVLAQGPWYENSLHGSSMMGLMARAAEQHPSEIPRLVSRLTVDLMRAAPMAPLHTKSQLLRSGKNVEFLDIGLYAGDELYVRATAMRIRIKDIPMPEDYFRGFPPYPQVPQEEDLGFFQFPGAEKPAFHHAIDMRMDEFEGFPVLWFKLAVPFVEGETNTSIISLASACDWTYAVPNIVFRRKNAVEMAEQPFFSINPDTTINFFRPAQGEWLGLKAQPSYGDLGSGTCGAQLFDEQGPIGFSSQSILIRGNEGAPMHVKEKQASKKA